MAGRSSTCNNRVRRKAPQRTKASEQSCSTAPIARPLLLQETRNTRNNTNRDRSGGRSSGEPRRRRATGVRRRPQATAYPRLASGTGRRTGGDNNRAGKTGHRGAPDSGSDSQPANGVTPHSRGTPAPTPVPTMPNAEAQSHGRPAAARSTERSSKRPTIWVGVRRSSGIGQAALSSP